MDPVLASRITCMFLLLLGTFFFGVLPIFVRKALLRCDCVGPTCKPKCRARRGKLITAFLIYFGGGVLLGTCLLHLLPESREGFEDHDHDHDEQNATLFFHPHTKQPSGNDTAPEGHHHETFPLAEFIVCCGFFAVYLFEEIIHFFIGGHSHVPSEARAIRSMSRSSSCCDQQRVSNAGLPTLIRANSLQRSGQYKVDGNNTGELSIIEEHVQAANANQHSEDIKPDERQESGRTKSGEIQKSGEHQHSGQHKEVGQDGLRTPPMAPPVHSHDAPPSFTTSEKISLVGLLTVAALSFHSLFEGFAVGLQSDAVNTWIVFAAIAVHKYVIAFVVGLEVLAGGGKNKQVYVYMAVFCAMSPLGMLIAMITQTQVEETNPVAVSTLNAIATGTLLYVTFFEILQKDEHKDIATWIQLIATFLGFGLMCLMQYVSTFA